MRLRADRRCRGDGWLGIGRMRAATTWLGTVLMLGVGGTVAAAQFAPKQAAILALRHYALSACLAQAFPAIADEARAAQGAYLEFGSHPAETYQAVQQMAERWLRRDYPSFRPVTLDVMKCIDFSESAELGRLARRTLPRQH